ncbi:hypothetical protein E2C01_040458 [Portunus trituberculatus]|uniref:Uncharacterized protein n=1 Tax=Portunus trituberculatus TaxID=210409 RepID=A0A5B7FJS0_PORTR|nr:hypothetical protein [Portunus trituberculatus]
MACHKLEYNNWCRVGTPLHHRSFPTVSFISIQRVPPARSVGNVDGIRWAEDKQKGGGRRGNE